MSTRDKIRLVFFSDTHLGFDYPIRPRVERRRRGPDFFDNYRRVLDYAVEQKVDLVIHGGDIFFRSKIPTKIVDLTYDALFKFADSGIDFYLVPGNHERSKIPDSLLLSRSNIHIFRKPDTLVQVVSSARIAISGFPCVRDNIRDRFPEILEETGWRNTDADVKLLCVHQAVEGSQVGPANFTFRHGEDVIQMRDIPAGFNAVLAGHIHRRQILQRPADECGRSVQVIFAGSTERTSFAEKDEPKGFYVIEFEPTEDGPWGISRLEFKPLPARPMKDLEVDGRMVGKDLAGFLRAELAKIDQDAIVRLRPRGEIPAEAARILTGPFLRGIFPDTMNYQLSSAFYGKRPGHD